MKVLFIGYVWPEPDSSAAGRRVLDLLSLFREMDADISFACAAEPGQNPADLAAIGVRPLRIRLNCESFDKQLLTLQPDIVVFDRFLCEEQFSWRVERCCPDAMRILDTEDLHCLRDARRRALHAGRSLADSDLRSELALREVAAIWRSDLSLIISSYEFELLTDFFGVDPDILLYLPLFVDAACLARPSKPFTQRRHCVVVGNFRHAPNWDALQYLRSDIWPRVRSQIGDVQCHVYGAYQPPKARALHSEKLGFLLKGWAKNARSVVSDARLCLAPLRFGAGQKGKLLEAMECGTPSITTPVGAEGMATCDQWPGAVAADRAAFIAACVTLYTDPDKWQAAVARIAPVLEQGFLRDHFKINFFNKINEIISNVNLHREKFFVGLMIRQQRLRSHQYMSQWIEAKNALLRHKTEN